MAKLLDKLTRKTTQETEKKAFNEEFLSEEMDSNDFLAGQLSDKKFWTLFHKSVFDGGQADAKHLLDSFIHNYGPTQFFESFDDREAAINVYQTYFGSNAIQQTIERAEQVARGKFDLLGFSNLDFGTPVDWTLDPLSGKRFAPAADIDFAEYKADGEADPKIVWELNRHQHFFILGVAYWLTGNEKYAVTFNMHLSGWIEQNPPEIGINWTNNREIAFRVISWLWALHFFKTSPNLSPTIFADILKFLYLHAKHLEANLSFTSDLPINLIIESLALFYVGTLLPQFQAAKKWRIIGTEILFNELERQIQPDGVHREQATWFQRYVVDACTHLLLLGRLNSSASESPDHAKLEAKLQQTLDFLMYITRPDGTTPLIGDDDGGRMLPLSINAINDFRSALSVGAVLFDRGDYKFVAREASEEIFWLLKAESLKKFAAIKPHAPHYFSKKFADSGYFVMRDGWTEKNNFLLIDGGKHGSVADKNAHLDALSFELAVKGRTTLVDPGTFAREPNSHNQTAYLRSAAAHNTLTIRGKSSNPGDKFAWTTIGKKDSEENLTNRFFDFFQSSHHSLLHSTQLDAKNESLVFAHTRSVLFVRHNYWIIVDLGVAVGKHDFELNFHFDISAAPHIAFHENRIFVHNPSNNDQENGLKIFAFGDNGRWELFNDWVAPCYGLRVPALTANYSSAGFNQQKIVSFLFPSSNALDAPFAEESGAVGGRAFAVKYKRNRDWFILADDQAVSVNHNHFVSDFRFAWVRFDSLERTVEEVILVGGNRFVHNEMEIYHSREPKRCVVGRRINHELVFEDC